MRGSPDLPGLVQVWHQRAWEMHESPGAYNFPDVNAAMRTIVSMNAETLALISTELGNIKAEFEQVKDHRHVLTKKVADLKAAGEKLDKELAGAKKDFDARLASTKKQLEDAQGLIQLLSRRVGATRETLDQVLRQFRAIVSPDMKADINGWSADHAELGQRAASGRTAKSRLDAMDDQGLDAPIANYRRIEQEHLTRQSRAIDAARSMTSLPPNAASRKWRTHMRAWRRNRDDAVRLAKELRELEPRKRAAEENLEEFSARKSELAGAVADGHKAETELRGEIHGYLDEIYATDRIPPCWFGVAMGFAVSPTRTEQWLLTAVEVVLYRVVYGVVDNVNPLGVRPTDDERGAEHDQLKARCAEYRL